MAATYEVNSTPTIIVDGRYLTTPSQVDGANPGTPRAQLNAATLQVLDALVAQARASKK